jgi:hypothetical protein
MAAKMQAKKTATADHVVLAIRKRGLWRNVLVFGPFTKAQAHVFATHHQQYEGDECSVEELDSPCEHNKWIFDGVS